MAESQVERTTHDLARELLALPAVPVFVVVRCLIDGEDFSTASGTPGQYELASGVDGDGKSWVTVLATDTDLFEYLDSEEADDARDRHREDTMDDEEADYAYESEAACVQAGEHLTDCDAGGFCNRCGYQ